jgi:hypothetical protein
MSADRKYMHPDADKALHNAQVDANMQIVVVQTLGTADASAGTHERDGYYVDSKGKKVPYSAALDISVNQGFTRITDKKRMPMGELHIKWLLRNLALHGFVCWYRRPEQGFDYHIHAVYVGCPMKDILKRQVEDFLEGKDGLRSHRKEQFWTAPAEMDAQLKALYEKFN